jgi:hypothetical protein
VTAEPVAEIQRLLAAEFERRGWEYDLVVGRVISEEIAREGQFDASRLVRLVPSEFLARARATRAEVTDAIAKALSGLTPSTERLAHDDQRAGMRVLFVAAGPADQTRLRLDAEHREIRNRIRSSTARAQVVLDTALAARPVDLIDELNRLKPSILHLAGHGGPTGIALENEAGDAVDVTTEQLSRLISTAPLSLRLVVLNTCESSHQARPIVAHIDAAIGMTREIGDDAARLFSAQLYSSLAEGVPLDRAFEQAKLQISLGGLDEDETPGLYTRRGMSGSDLIFVD